MDVDRSTNGIEIRKESIGPEKKINRSVCVTTTKVIQRPKGMTREVFALMDNDKKDIAPLIPTDTGHGYKKKNSTIKHVRPWKWMPFTNPARTDNAVFYHWRSTTDEGKDYPFAQFNKKVQIPTYSDTEYNTYLTDDCWTKSETDHLFDLCRRFDLRFGVVADRWDITKYNKRTIEDLKERYYCLCSSLARVKTGIGLTPEIKNYAFDAEHERKRKEQLNRFYRKTKEQVKEEQMLRNELRKIEAHKKERDKKTQDLQKLLTAADKQVGKARKPGKIPKRKSLPNSL